MRLFRSLAASLFPAMADAQYIKPADDGPSVDFNDIFSLRRPKDAKAGFSSGLKSLGKGIVGGAVGLVAAPVIGAQRDGVAGFAKGVLTGVAGAVLLPVTGAAVGTVQMVRGMANTPEAMAEAQKGRTWNENTREWMDTPDGAMVTAESARFANDQVGADSPSAAAACGGTAQGSSVDTGKPPLVLANKGRPIAAAAAHGWHHVPVHACMHAWRHCLPAFFVAVHYSSTRMCTSIPAPVRRQCRRKGRVLV